jgi:hypothetical protein
MHLIYTIGSTVSQRSPYALKDFLFQQTNFNTLPLWRPVRDIETPPFVCATLPEEPDLDQMTKNVFYSFKEDTEENCTMRKSSAWD